MADDSDPRWHTQKMQKALTEIQDHLREDIQKVNEPQLKAMFETAAEVLGGSTKAFRDYEQKNEAAWRKSAATVARGERTTEAASVISVVADRVMRCLILLSTRRSPTSERSRSAKRQKWTCQFIR